MESYEAQMFGEARSPRCLEKLKGLQAKWVRERLKRGALGVSWEACEMLVEPRRGSWGALGGSLGPLGGFLEPLGRFLEPLGGLLGVIRVILEAAGRILGPLGALLGPLGRILGCSWEHFGGIWG